MKQVCFYFTRRCALPAATRPLPRRPRWWGAVFLSLLAMAGTGQAHAPAAAGPELAAATRLGGRVGGAAGQALAAPAAGPQGTGGGALRQPQLLPIAIPGANRDVCANTPTALGAAPVPGNTYSWSPTTGLNNPTIANPTATLPNASSAPVTTTYTLTVTDGSGASATGTVEVRVLSAVVADAGPSQTVCSGQSLTVGTPGLPGYTYTWPTSQAGFTVNNPALAQPTYTFTNPYTVSFFRDLVLQVRAPNGCSTTTSVRVTVQPAITVDAGPDQAGCAGSTVTLGTPAQTGYTYSWSPATGLSNPAAAQPTLTLGTTGTTTYTLTVSANGCSLTDPVVVTVTPAATANAGANATVCAGQSVTLGTPAVAGYAYSWSPATNLSSATVAQPVFTAPTSVAAPLAFAYTLTVTPASPSGGCLATGQVMVSVAPTPVAGPISGPAAVCDFGQPQQYRVASVAGTTYQWGVTGGTLTAGQGTAQVTVQFGPGAAGYAVRVVPTSAAGCAGAATSLSISPDQPTVALTVASVAATDNTQVLLTLAAGSNSGAAVRVLRRPAGQGSFATVGTVPATATTFTDTGLDAAATSYEYRLDLPNACGGLVSSAVAQTIRLEASNAASPGTGGANQGSTALRWTAYAGFPVVEYRLYRSLDGGAPALLTTVSGTTLQAAVPNSGAAAGTGAGFSQQFRVVAVGAGSAPLLANSNTAGVSFANLVRTYNIITPNGDQLNDVFSIDNIGLYPGNTLRIFNRWGREVFAATNYQNNWGNAAEVAPGTYYYLLAVPGRSPLKGWVEVVK